jgi:glycosyltransferase involved in cell wall biosynthesis
MEKEMPPEKSLRNYENYCMPDQSNGAPIPVLFLLMEFAPVNTTGNFRHLKFVKYLGQYAIQPIVVTFIEEEGSRFFDAKIDQELLQQLPADTIIYRIHCRDRRKFFVQKVADFLTIYFSIKDSLAARWKPYLFKELGGIISKHQPKAIVTSLPPFSSGLLAQEVSKKYGLPLVLDMRDLWALFGSGPSPSYIHYSLMIREERKIFKDAAAIICVTPQMISAITKAHTSLDKRKIHLIPNGFDKELEQLEDIYLAGGKQKVVIGYVGAFYYNPASRNNVFKPWWRKSGLKMLEYVPVVQDWLYRSPYFFFKAMNRLFEKYPAFKSIIQIEFVGKKPEWLDDMVTEFDLEKNIVSHGFVPYKTSLKLQENFDLMLATSEKFSGGEHYCLPSKVFDYVIQGKPVLGFVTDGIQKEFLEKSGLAVICNPDDLEDAVEKIYQLLTAGQVFKPNYAYLSGFKRTTLTSQLARLLRDIVVN